MLPAAAALETPPDKTLHLICDNYATHKPPKVKGRLPSTHAPMSNSGDPRCPGSTWSSASFGISVQCLHNGAFRSVSEPTGAIKEYIAVHNNDPKLFVWTAEAHDMLDKVNRANRI